MNKKDLILNNLQWLIYHKTKPNRTKPIIYVVIYLFICILQDVDLSSVYLCYLNPTKMVHLSEIFDCAWVLLKRR